MTHYYILPGTGIYGGIKKAFHAVEHISSAGKDAAIAMPVMKRPSWFPNTVNIITRRKLARIAKNDDVALFSHPDDADFVASLPCRKKVLHMQGAAPQVMPLLDRNFKIIVTGLHMAQETLRRGIIAPYVTMGIPDVFRWHGEDKKKDSICLMTRKAGHFAEIIKQMDSGIKLTIIDGMSEDDVARTMKESDIFVAISPDEWFGLPPLEAMAAACCVVGFPGVGGFEFMHHMENALLVPNGNASFLANAVRKLLNDCHLRDRLRNNAMKTAAYYTMGHERKLLNKALNI
jgi:glycosyltransferase involved in cell wall biosynthesis